MHTAKTVEADNDLCPLAPEKIKYPGQTGPRKLMFLTFFYFTRERFILYYHDQPW